MILTFDLLTLKLIVSSPCHIVHLCHFSPKSIYLFSKYRVHKIGNKGTDGRTEGRTNGHVENVIPPPSLDWRRYKKS